MTSILAFIFWVAAAMQAAPAQQAQSAPGNRASARVTVSGSTIPADSTQPLAYVSVKLLPMDDPPSAAPPLTGRGGVNPVGTYQATSDAAGNFVFSNIAPGRYTISAEREGYLLTQSALTLVSGQNAVGLIVAMPTVPAISGIVYSPYGQRLAGASVQAFRVQYTPYGRQLVRVATVLSHEGGEYRLFHLDPGYYYVSASYSGRSLQPWKSLLEITPNLSNPDDGYSTVYFPAEMKVANAKAINLNNGGVANIDISFRESQYFKLSIKVTIPPPRTNIRNPKIALFPAGTDLGSVQDYVIKGTGTRFSIDRLAAGDYVLVALDDFRDAAGNTYTGIVSDTLPVRVTEDAEVTIAAIDPFDQPGRVTMPSRAALPSRMQIQLVRVDALANQTISADVDSAGNFTLPQVGPGTYDVFLKGLPSNLILQEARFSYSDRRLIQVKADASLPPRTWQCGSPDCRNSILVSDAPLMASVVQNGTAVNGTVVDDRGRNAAAEVVFVPLDPVVRFRRDRYIVAYSDASGAFAAKGIPPGMYTAFAFEKIEPDIYYDPDFNMRLAPLGRLVTVGGANLPLDRPLIRISREEVASLTQ